MSRDPFPMTTLTVYPGIEALIFDLDGTLADSMPLHFEAWQITAKEFGFDFPKHLFYAWAGIPTIKVTALLNEHLGLGLDIDEVFARREQNYLEMEREMPKIAPVYAFAASQLGKYLFACGTGGTRLLAEKTLAGMGIRHWFPVVVTADDVSAHKPDPETFLKCAEAMGIAPAKCQVFEDGDLGLDAARAAGMAATDVRLFL